MNGPKLLNVIVTGATGMVGEGVLQICLNDQTVDSVLVIGRRSCELQHPKLKEIILPDFFSPASLAGALSGYDACYFCLGVSSVGMSKEEYYKMTYTLTLGFAEMLVMDSPQAAFCYVSGAGTDSSESRNSPWARVKGKTENDLMKLPFANVYAFRPGFIKPFPGLKRVNKHYKYINWLFPIGRKLFPNGFIRLEELGRAMLYLTRERIAQKIISGNDIHRFGKESIA